MRMLHPDEIEIRAAIVRVARTDAERHPRTGCGSAHDRELVATAAEMSAEDASRAERERAELRDRR